MVALFGAFGVGGLELAGGEGVAYAADGAEDGGEAAVVDDALERFSAGSAKYLLRFICLSLLSEFSTFAIISQFYPFFNTFLKFYLYEA